MSDVLKRTVFVEVGPSGALIPCDYAQVTTSAGTFMEPFPTWFQRKQIGAQMAAFDHTDPGVRIDAIEFIRRDQERERFGGLTWGGINFRTGR